MKKTTIYTRDLQKLGEKTWMTKIQMAPKIKKKEQYTFIRQEDWITFIRSLESGKMYRLSELVQFFNTTMRPLNKL